MGWFPAAITMYSGIGVFLFSFAENVGLPIPAFPVLLVAGALSQSGRASLPFVLAGAMGGALLADAMWYLLGRWRGRSVLSTLCRVSLNPDACVEGAEEGFRRRRSLTILLAKFLPGVNTVMPPLAGITAYPFFRFLSLDLLGSFIWAAAGIGIGWAFGDAVAGHVDRINGMLGGLVAVGLAAYLGWTVAFRRYLVRKYAAPRIAAEDLHRRMSEGEEIHVLDLRSDAAFGASGVTVPGAVRVRPATFHRVAHEFPKDRELVFFCT
jgi:membrane protein DedA with SNARE-associated domain